MNMNSSDKMSTPKIVYNFSDGIFGSPTNKNSEIGVNTYSVKYIEDSDSSDNSEKFNGTANKDKKD